MEQGLVPAVPAWPWGSWGVTVAAACSGDPWDVGGIAAPPVSPLQEGKG